MEFSSVIFLIFIIITLLTYWNISKKENKTLFLSIISLIFYGFWSPIYLFLLFFIIITNFTFGILLVEIQNKILKRILFLLTIISNIGLLFLFKYYDFFISNINSLAGLIGISINLKLLKIGSIVGLSFYIFQALTYTIDLYKEKINVCRNFIAFMAFVAFFPTVNSGPITKSRILLPQLFKNRTFKWKIFYSGLFLIILGLFKKMVISNNLAPFANRVFDYHIPISFIEAWVGSICYTIQIYMDFSGYSDIAIGVALLFGFSIPLNFNNPYSSLSFTDFWKRWHITLSSWFMNYLFLPIAYRISKKLPKYKYLGIKTDLIIYTYAVLITFLLCGFWHGASWTFILWGTIHGVFLSIERIFKQNKTRVKVVTIKTTLRKLVIFLIINMTWVLFRSSDLAVSQRIYKAMLGFSDKQRVDLFSYGEALIVIILTIAILIITFKFSSIPNILKTKTKKYQPALYITLVILMSIMIIYFKGTNGQFIYFQF